MDSTSAHFEGGLPATRSWSVVSAGFVTSSYRNPTVAAVTGAELMLTNGGAPPVTLIGTDFPPFACADAAACGGSASMVWQLSTASLAVSINWEDNTWESVTGSSTGGSFLSVTCLTLKVTVPGTQAECVVGPGVGSGLNWGVTVGAKGIASVALSSGLQQFPATGFAGPEITQLVPSDNLAVAEAVVPSVHALTTSGGQTVVLQGRNLGGEYETLASSIGVEGLKAPRLLVSYGPAGSVGVNANRDDGGATKYDAAECVVIVEHAEIACTTVRMSTRCPVMPL